MENSPYRGCLCPKLVFPGLLVSHSSSSVPGAHLLQRGGAELDGDVVELPVLLSAEVADDVGVLI